MTEAELIERLQRLERANRQLWLLAVGAVALLAAVIGFRVAYAAPGIPQKIVAHEFDVVDGSGKARIRMKVQSNSIATVQILDTAGVVQAQMIEGPVTGPGIELGLHKVPDFLQVGAPGMLGSDIQIGDIPQIGPMISVNRPGSILGPATVMSALPDGRVGFAILDSKAHDRVDITLSKAGQPNIELSDFQGYTMDLGSTDTVAPATGETQQTSAASIVMFGNDKEHHVIWRAP